jgi:hypothetical protein
MRRDHAKYLTLIDAIAFLHQHQRPNHRTTVGGQAVEYVEVTLEDIALANRLAHEVLGRSLDELPPQTRRVLGLLDAWVHERCAAQAIERRELRFTRREVRAITGMRDTQARVHLERLVQLDYVLPHRGQRGQSFVYELLFDGEADSTAAQLVGLLDVEALRVGATLPGSRGAAPEFAGSSRPHGGAFAAGSRLQETPLPASAGATVPPLVAALDPEARLGPSRAATQRKPNGATAAP